MQLHKLPLTTLWILTVIALLLFGQFGIPDSISYWGIWRSFNSSSDILTGALVVVVISWFTLALDLSIFNFEFKTPPGFLSLATTLIIIMT